MLKGASVRLGPRCDRTHFTPEGRPRHVLIIAESYRKRFIENESACLLLRFPPIPRGMVQKGKLQPSSTIKELSSGHIICVVGVCSWCVGSECADVVQRYTSGSMTPHRELPNHSMGRTLKGQVAHPNRRTEGRNGLPFRPI